MDRRGMQVGPRTEGGAAMTMTPDEGRRRGQARRDEGLDRAAARREWQIQHGTLAFLDAMQNRPDHTAATDDAAYDLSRKYEDGGRADERQISERPICTPEHEPQDPPKENS